MTFEEFGELVEGLEVDDLSALEGEVQVQGPWDCRYVFDLKIEVSGRPVGVHGEFVIDDDDQTVEKVELLKFYDLAGLDEDAEITDGSKLIGNECAEACDQLAEMLDLD